MSKICPNCKCEISDQKKFCSRKCANIYNAKNESRNKKLSLSVKNTLVNKGIHIGLYKKECRYCHNIFETDVKNKKFCNSKCAAFYNNQHRSWKMDEKTKLKIKKSINNYVINTIFKDKQIKCSDKNLCNVCGSEKGKCKHPNICNKNIILKKKVLEKLGFDFSVYGSEKVYDEYYKINKLILDLYCNKKLALTEICKLYNISSESSLLSTFDMYGIHRRNISNSLKNALDTGRWKPKFNGLYPHKKTCISKYNFKHGWHTTWDNNQIYYRSSYELNYAKKLDELKIHYDVENLNITYFDSIKNKYRISVPDFFIPSKSLIVEIKGFLTYNKQNMIDRFKAYKQQGYDYKLIIEGKDVGKRLPETSKNYIES